MKKNISGGGLCESAKVGATDVFVDLSSGKAYAFSGGSLSVEGAPGLSGSGVGVEGDTNLKAVGGNAYISIRDVTIGNLSVVNENR